MLRNCHKRTGTRVCPRGWLFVALASGTSALGVGSVMGAETQRNPFFPAHEPIVANSQTESETQVNWVAPNNKRVNFIALPDVRATAAQAIAHTESPLPRQKVRRLPPVNVSPPTTVTPTAPENVGDTGDAATAPTPIESLGVPSASKLVPKIDAPSGKVTVDEAGKFTSVTPAICSQRAASKLNDAYREYSVKAWASAESSAWQALELIAMEIDLEGSQSDSANASARTRLSSARVAMKEAREFVIGGWVPDPSYLAGIIKSHRTPACRDVPSTALTKAVAIDRYLDFARSELVPLANTKVQAAQAMDLLAAIAIARNNAAHLPTETALSFRRAAFAGQPSNGSLASRLGLQLADMGLDREAAEILDHAAGIDPTQEVERARATVASRMSSAHLASHRMASQTERNDGAGNQDRVPELVQLSPRDFAAISPMLNVGQSAGAGTSAIPKPTLSQVPQPTVAPKKSPKGWLSPASLFSFVGKKNASAESVPSSTIVDTTLPEDQDPGQAIYRSDVQVKYQEPTPKKNSRWNVSALLPKIPSVW